MARLYPPPSSGRRPALPEGPAPLLVVGLVGGEAQGPNAWANRLVELPAFRVPGGTTAAEPCELCMHHDRLHGVLYLTLTSGLASAVLVEHATALARAESEHAVHALLVERSSEHLRALLLLFHLSHVVLVHSEGRCADVTLLRTLRLLHTLKQAVQPAVLAALKPVLSGVARGAAPPLPSLPALGFVFASPPVADPDAKAADGGPSPRL